MHKTILALGLGSLLLAGCAADPANAERSAIRDEGYTPTGSRIPRRDPKPSDMPAVSSSGLDALSRSVGLPRPQ